MLCLLGGLLSFIKLMEETAEFPETNFSQLATVSLFWIGFSMDFPALAIMAFPRRSLKQLASVQGKPSLTRSPGLFSHVRLRFADDRVNEHQPSHRKPDREPYGPAKYARQTSNIQSLHRHAHASGKQCVLRAHGLQIHTVLSLFH